MILILALLIFFGLFVFIGVFVIDPLAKKVVDYYWKHLK